MWQELNIDMYILERGNNDWQDKPQAHNYNYL